MAELILVKQMKISQICHEECLKLTLTFSLKQLIAYLFQLYTTVSDINDTLFVRPPLHPLIHCNITMVMVV